MKNFKYSNKWKTDPRAAYIPGAAMAFLMIVFLMVGPAWSFETIQGDDASAEMHEKHQALTSTHRSSPTVVDPCLPLLKSIHTSPTSAMDRNQRSAGKAAAVGLLIGVRFALSSPQKVKSHADRPRLDVWQTSGVSAGDRNALAVSAYRQCQKKQALNALSEFRWAR